MKNKKIKIIFLTLAFFLFLTPPLAKIIAQELNYTPMEAIPGIDPSNSCDFYFYVVATYNFCLAFVGVAAMVMIIIGGFMYTTSAGNNASMGKAKEVITDAIIGLALALLGYLLLYIINPDLVSVSKMRIGQATGCQSTSGSNAKDNNGNAIPPCQGGGVPPCPNPPQTPTPGSTPQCEADARNEMSQAGITTQRNCTTQGTVGCTNLCTSWTNIGSKITALSQKCGVNYISGGDEIGRGDHASGHAVDWHANDDQIKCISDNRTALGITKICTDPAHQSQSYNCGTYPENSGIIHTSL